MNNVTNNININITITAFEECPLPITREQIETTLRLSENIARFSKYTTREQESEQRRPLMIESILDFIKQTHTEESSRNVCMREKSKNEVLVRTKNDEWSKYPLTEALSKMLYQLGTAIKTITDNPQEYRRIDYDILIIFEIYTRIKTATLMSTDLKSTLSRYLKDQTQEHNPTLNEEKTRKEKTK